VAKKQPRRLSPLTDYKEIARQFHEEVPLYECKNCFRETVHGEETVKSGEVCGNMRNWTCFICGKPMRPLE